MCVCISSASDRKYLHNSKCIMCAFELDIMWTLGIPFFDGKTHSKTEMSKDNISNVSTMIVNRIDYGKSDMRKHIYLLHACSQTNERSGGETFLAIFDNILYTYIYTLYVYI